jgi:hypothetical protein
MAEPSREFFPNSRISLSETNDSHRFSRWGSFIVKFVIICRLFSGSPVLLRSTPPESSKISALSPVPPPLESLDSRHRTIRPGAPDSVFEPGSWGCHSCPFSSRSNARRRTLAPHRQNPQNLPEKSERRRHPPTPLFLQRSATACIRNRKHSSPPTRSNPPAPPSPLLPEQVR